MTTYTIPAVAKDELKKKLEKLQKKANAYGNKLECSFGEEKAVDRNVYSVDANTHTQVFTGKEKVFGVEVSIESDIIRKDGYTVVAQIEAVDNGQNIVKMLDDSKPEQAWYTAKLFCEHCGTARVKRFAYIVRDEAGNTKMVGKTCLKDYCGIDPKLMVWAQEIGDLILEEYNIDDYDFRGQGEYAYEVLDVLATANDIIKEHGYVKSDENNSTKSRLIAKFGTFEPSEESKKLAKEMKEVLSQMDYSELSSFLCNVKNMLQAGYIRSNSFGYIAYAPVAFEKMMKQIEQEQRHEETKGLSEYVGNVGDKLTVDVKEAKLVTSWETVYGWTHLYKFITADNNVLVWKASRYYEGEPKRITGTVKDHKEYDGEKQTILTRCKITEKKEDVQEHPAGCFDFSVLDWD